MLSGRFLVLLLLAIAFLPVTYADDPQPLDGRATTLASDPGSETREKAEPVDSQSIEDIDDVPAGEESSQLVEDATSKVETEIDPSTSSLPASSDNTTSQTDSQLSTESSDAQDHYQQQQQQQPPIQSGPFVDLLGPQLLSMEMIDETHAQLVPHNTNEALQGKATVGFLFSADWCRPCVAFLPELLEFYNKINARKGREDQFQIVWVSRCRDVDSYAQYFAKMPGWLALPPQEAMGERGRWLGEKYGVKSIPSLVLVDDLGQLITKDARNKVPADRAGIGFPWRNPLANIYLTLVPRSVRFMINSQVVLVKDKIMTKLKTIIPNRGALKAA